MSRILQSGQIDHPQQLMEIVVDGIDEIQKGAIVLDTTLGNEEYGYIDIVAANETKRGMFFFLNFSGHEANFFSAIKCLQWVRENQSIFHKLYAGKIDFDHPADILFISPHFTPCIQKVLLNLKEGRIVLLKYNCFHYEKETKIVLEKIANSLKIADSLEIADPLENEKNEKNHRVTDHITDNANPKIRPEKVKPFTPPNKPAIDLDKFRQELDIDISNISDEELSALLE